jgi:hypothetical protein
VAFDDQITAVFAQGVRVTADPLGLDLSGTVSLLRAKDRKGKQKTLAKGSFYGSFTRDTDGDLALSGADKDDVTSRGDLLVAGEVPGEDSPAVVQMTGRADSVTWAVVNAR